MSTFLFFWMNYPFNKALKSHTVPVSHIYVIYVCIVKFKQRHFKILLFCGTLAYLISDNTYLCASCLSE